MNDQSQAGVMDIASGVRQANDTDVLEALDIQSSKSLEKLNRLYYYVVSADWMRKAWPLLSGSCDDDEEGNLRETVGRIENEVLLVRDNIIMDEEEDESSSRARHELMLNELQTRTAYKSKTSPGVQRFIREHQTRAVELRIEKTHTKDFFLLGPNAWLVVKLKFGCDQEIKRKCTFLEQTDGTSLAVVLHDADAASDRKAVHIPIPPTGRFGYESALDNRLDLAVGAADDLNYPGNVSDDETDLFPMLDDVEDNHIDSTDQVFLLPNSTTPVATNRDGNYDWKMNGDSDSSDHAEVVESKAVLRRYGSGLGNLGNTCFMNSTLQCLAHTDPIRKYFLSGAYARDLNRVNPLGTGGELATQFAQLLADMWSTASTSSSVGGYQGYGRSMLSSDPESTTSVVYPRNFKFALGKHAEQFMGYDQHDSQELATYLLDALHEDTNLVTKKPFVEKPEQNEQETDEEAADKAWSLHLRREDSFVLENFMGQVKSRVQCSTKGCGRVSTTFDPFMFLSVPIPGSSDRSIQITFVPLDPHVRPKTFSITINKLASIGDLAKKVQERIGEQGYTVQIEDLAFCDVWKKDIHSWHTFDKDVDIIRESDETFVYELTPLNEIRKLEESAAQEARKLVDENSLGLRSETPGVRRYKLDLAELGRINDEWTKELDKYIRSPITYYAAFNPNKGSTEERVAIYKKLTTFVDLCFKEVDYDTDTSGQKRGRDVENDTSGATYVFPQEPPIRAIEDRADTQHIFKNVRSMYDVVVLDFLSKKIRQEIVRLEKERVQHFPDGVSIEIRMRKSSSFSSRDQNIATPMALRIPSSMSVYGLRKELAHRLVRSLKHGHDPSTTLLPGEQTAQGEVVPVPDSNGNGDHRLGSPALLCLRQIPLSFQRGSAIRSHVAGGRQLGSLQKPGFQSGAKLISLASPSDESEKMSVAQLVGDQGVVFLDWPEEGAARFFDVAEYESVDDADISVEDPGKSRQRPNATNLLECIEKYCQMEQLEDTEMWYCNRCKEHVRAWKQFHIFRSPPILLIHLKRFQYSPRTHRRNKINLFIDFPLKNLDLTEHVLHWDDEEKPIYDCFAVSNHYGGLGGGHYTAHALNDDGEWCYYDDSRITTSVDPKEVVSDAAYVLYYRRRDVAVGEDFVMNLHTPGMPSPALIQVDKGPHDNEASELSSSAAMVGEDMDIDDTDDVASRATMGSTDDGEDHLYAENEYVTDRSDREENQSDLSPLQ